MPPVTDIVISREESISRLRRKLLELTDGRTSACAVAAQRGILCRGFARYNEQQLRRVYPHLAAPDREALEQAANEWQLQRQVDAGTVVACDTQQMHYETCRGWADYSNAELTRFCRELLGQEVVVTGHRTLPVI